MRDSRLSHVIRGLCLDEDGPTSVEYALMVAMIAFAIVAAMTVFSEAMMQIWMANADLITVS